MHDWGLTFWVEYHMIKAINNYNKYFYRFKCNEGAEGIPQQSHIFCQRTEVTGWKPPQFRYDIDIPTGAAFLKYCRSVCVFWTVCPQNQQKPARDGNMVERDAVTRYVCRVLSEDKFIMSGQKFGWYRGLIVPCRNSRILAGDFLCTRAPRGNVSAEADGCPVREQERRPFSSLIVQTCAKEKCLKK